MQLFLREECGLGVWVSGPSHSSLFPPKKNRMLSGKYGGPGEKVLVTREKDPRLGSTSLDNWGNGSCSQVRENVHCNVNC